MYPIVSIYLLGFWLDHYTDRLLEARLTGAGNTELQFLEDQCYYYRIRFNNFFH